MVRPQGGAPTWIKIHFYGIHRDQASHQKTVDHGPGQRQISRALRKQVRGGKKNVHQIVEYL